jgi:hypothetical protein
MLTTYNCLPETAGNPLNSGALSSQRRQNSIGQFRSRTLGCARKNGALNNKVINYLINQAMAGSYQNTTPQYPGMFLSNRPLTGPENASAATDQKGNIIFRWVDNSGLQTAHPNDKVIMITYLPAIKEIIYTLHTATRASSIALLIIDKWKGHTTENWIGFVSRDERVTCDCVYVGSVQL